MQYKVKYNWRAVDRWLPPFSLAAASHYSGSALRLIIIIAIMVTIMVMIMVTIMVTVMVTIMETIFIRLFLIYVCNVCTM